MVKIHVVWKRLAIWHSFRLVWVFGWEGEKREKGKTNCQKKGRRRRRRIVPTNRPRHHQTFWVGEGKRSRRPFLSTTSFGRGKKKGPFLSSVLKWRRLSYPPLQSSLPRGQGSFIPDFLWFSFLYSSGGPEQKLGEMMRAKEKKERKFFIEIIKIRSVHIKHTCIFYYCCLRFLRRSGFYSVCVISFCASPTYVYIFSFFC